MQEIVNIIWSGNLLLGRIIIVLVVMASMLATALALYHIWRYRFFETGNLLLLKGSLQRWQKEQRGSEQELVKLEALKKLTAPGSLTHHRLLTIERMRATNVKVDFEALQQITFAAESAQLGLRAPAFGINFVLLLGLFGSIASLCLTLPGLSGTDADFNSAFGAMTASFSAGMVGLLGSIWISLINLSLTTAQAQFFEKFERFTIEELLPQTVSDIRNEAWLRQMHYKIGEAFERIKEIAEQNNQTVKEFGTVAEGFSHLVDSLEQSARKGASADVQKVLGQLGQVIGEVSRSNDTTLNLVNSVPKALETARSQNQNVLARVDALSQMTGQQHEKITGLLTATNEKLPQTLQALQHSNQAVIQHIDKAISKVGSTTAAPAAITLPLPTQTLKLFLYSIPVLFLLILLILLIR